MNIFIRRFHVPKSKANLPTYFSVAAQFPDGFWPRQPCYCLQPFLVRKQVSQNLYLHRIFCLLNFFVPIRSFSSNSFKLFGLKRSSNRSRSFKMRSVVRKNRDPSPLNTQQQPFYL